MTSKAYDKEDVLEPETAPKKSADGKSVRIAFAVAINQTMCFRVAAEIFESMPGYKDSAERAKKLRERIKENEDSSLHSRAKEILDDAKEEFRKGRQDRNIQQIDKSEKMFSEAKELFRQIESFKDSSDLIKECEKYESECQQAVIRITAENLEAEAKAQKAKKRKKIFAAVAAALIVLGIGVIVFYATVIIPEKNNSEKYNSAMELLSRGKYDEAAEILYEINGYKD